MLDSLWQLLFDNGLNTDEIAGGINSLFTQTGTDADGNPIYGGTLGALADFPIIGMILKAFLSFAPATTETVS